MACFRQISDPIFIFKRPLYQPHEVTEWKREGELDISVVKAGGDGGRDEDGLAGGDQKWLMQNTFLKQSQ